jgi:acetyl esterase/lipase
MKSIVTLIAILAASVAFAQPPALGGGQARPNPNAEPETVLLWERGAPGALGDAAEDRPTLTIFRAAGAGGTSVIVAPGGGYSNLSMDKEGRQVASWFNAMGVTAYVLKYRLGPRYHHPIELGDAQRAIRLVRSRATQLGIAPDRIAMMGFSAGGHLAATAGTHFDDGNPSASDPIDRVGSRPDFLILAYPVISFDPAIAHRGSERSLLGDNPDPKLVQDLSNELQVTARTPPTFLFSTNADTTVPAENSVRFYLALRQAKVPAEMHIFQNGPHGVGLDLGDPALSLWPTLLSNWLRGRGLLTK